MECINAFRFSIREPSPDLIGTDFLDGPFNIGAKHTDIFHFQLSILNFKTTAPTISFSRCCCFSLIVYFKKYYF